MLKSLFLVYIVILNVWGFLIMKIDKRKAIRKEWRISEKRLWSIAILGGAIGTTFGMWTFHHKTKHFLFKFGFPLLAIADSILFYMMLDRLS